MKNTLAIAAGAALVLALSVLVVGAPALAQGPTATPTSPTTTTPTTGASPTPSAPAAACTNLATFVADVTIPDNTVVSPGQALTKTWRLRNRGTCTWGEGYTLAFVSGQAMTTNTSIAVPVTAPGATVDLSVPMTMPSTAGTFRGNWRLRAPNGGAFGDLVWIIVRVSSTGPAGAPAPAPPLSAAGVTLDDPARATTIGNPLSSLPASSAEWVQFTYDNGGNSLPRPTVTIVLLNGVTNGLTFQVYSPEDIAAGWSDTHPVGKGTTEAFTNCIENGVNVGRCTTDNLSWTGGFGLNGTYFVRIINNTGTTVAPQLTISGPGLVR